MDNHTQYSGFAGVDLAKKIMQIHFVTEDGEITDRQVKRAEFLDFFRNRSKCLIGMEACGASQDWARKLEAMGHEVHLMSPKAVKPFVSGQKNDHNDAIGIYKAMFNGVRRVPVKSTEIRDLQTLRRIRSQVAKDRIKEINHVRGLLAEYGIVMGRSHFPLSLRIEPYIFGETVHYKVGTIVSVILRPGYILSLIHI